MQRALGETCQPSGCLWELDCARDPDGGSECVPLRPVDAGCAGYQTCVPGALCVNDVCEVLGAAGASCGYGFQCASGVCQLGQCIDQCLR